MKAYGFIYDKQGNIKQVSAPIVLQIHESGTVGQHPLKKEKTKTGKIIPTVGHPGF